MRARSTIAMTLALLAVVTGGAGCGDDSEDQIASTVETYFHAFGAGDGGKACEQLGEEQATRLAEEARFVLPELGAGSCDEVIAGLASHLTAAQSSTLEGAVVDRVERDGSEATAWVSGAPRPARLIKFDEGWRIVGGLAVQ